MSDGPAPLVRSIEVRCSVAHAFATFTARIDLWWPPGHRRPGARVELEPGEGGRFVQRDAHGQVFEMGTVVRWEPPHRLAYTWRPGSPDAPTRVDVTFTESGDGTRVDVVHAPAALADDPTRWGNSVARFEGGWGAVLPAFATCAQSR